MSNTKKLRPATAADLLSKPARSKRIPLQVGDGEVEMELTAIGADAYDELLGEHPPTKEQEKDGSVYNADTFAPCLIAAVVSEPALSVEDATAIWKGSTWSRGELRDLFVACVELCQQGLDVPFTPAG